MLTRTRGRTAMRAILAVLDKRGPHAEQIVKTALDLIERSESECIRVASVLSPAAQGLENIGSRVVTSAAVGSVFSSDEISIMEIENGALLFQGRIYSPVLDPSPVTAIANEVAKGREKAIEKMITCFEGDFASVLTEPERIVAGRDPIGVQPLYYGENQFRAAVGSNRKVLWKTGIKEPRSFPPGNLGTATCEGFRFKPVKTLKFSQPKQITIQTAAETLLRILEHEVRVRVQSTKEVAVAFSGGLDSSLVAFLARKNCDEVQLIHVSLRGQLETEEARRAADELKLPLSVHLFTEEDVAGLVDKVVELIEESNPIKTAIGIPVYWAAQKTAEAGSKVLLTGQGADELFGGYQRYTNEYRLQGEEKARRTMFTDIERIHESNIERDKKICNFHNVELRLPFVSFKMAEFATSLPMELKLDCKANSLRKLVLRRVAENVGLPAWIARKPKKAIQYGTGTSVALKRLAKKRKTTIRGYLDQNFSEQTA